MNKPITMSHKEFIIKQISLKLVIPEKIITAVVTNQFDEAYSMLSQKNSIEFSGFGKFCFNSKRATSRMIKYTNQKAFYEKILEDETLSPAERRKNQKKLETALGIMEAIKNKMK